MTAINNNQEEYYSFALGRKVTSDELVGKTASDSFNSNTREQEINELKAKVASLEKEKEEAHNEGHKQGQEDQIRQSNREAIINMIPRNLPQYREDADFDREVEHRVNQINEYTTLDDLRGLYDAKIYKYSKQLAGKSASMERAQFYNWVHNPLSNISGNSIVHRGRGSNRITNPRVYEPIGSTASMNKKDPMWFLDLFNSSNYLGGS